MWCRTALLVVAGGLVLAAQAPAPLQQRDVVLTAGTPREQVELVDSGRHDYVVSHGGTMDGESSRNPMGVWAPEQAYESNLEVALANVGDVDVINPWVTNHRTAFASSRALVDSVLRPGMSDRDKVLAIFWKALSLRFHGDSHDAEGDTMRAFNGFGFNTCGGASQVLGHLWRTAGFPARLNLQPGHVVPEVFFDGKWHMLDGDLAAYYFDRQNKEIASFADLAEDHDLVRRGHSYGPLEPVSNATKNQTAALYALGRLFSATGRLRSHDDLYVNYWLRSFDKTAREDRQLLDDRHLMAMRLRPGESLTYRWERNSRVAGADFAGEGEVARSLITRSLWRYSPDVAHPGWQRGAEKASGVQETAEGLVASREGGEVTWVIRTPYPILRVAVDSGAAIRGVTWAVSPDGVAWQPLMASGLTMDGSQLQYAAWFRASLEPLALLPAVDLSAVIQTARVTLPSVQLGENRFTVTQEGSGRLQVTHRWIERSDNLPPAAPASVVYPAAGARVPMRDFRFEWTAAVDPEGAPIADYHVQVSEYADMRWPLSPTFDRLATRMVDLDEPEPVATTAGVLPPMMRMPRATVLNPETRYYWRVRARDARGFWGSWSKVAHFQVVAPPGVLRTRVESDGDRRWSLAWDAGRRGSRAVEFEIHGSNQRGFTARPDTVVGVANTHRWLAWEAGGTQLPFAYYRVVPIDRAGNRGPSSSLIHAPRPFIYSAPVTMAPVGQAYSYGPASVFSTGDQRLMDSAEGAIAEVDVLTWVLEQGPEWLHMKDGVLSGVPPEHGRFPVTIAVVSPTAGVHRQSFVLDSGGATLSPPIARDTAVPPCEAAALEVASAYYRIAASNAPLATFRDLLAPEFLTKAARVSEAPEYLEAAVRDIRERLQEFGQVGWAEVVPLSCTPESADLLVVIGYEQGSRVVRDRLTAVRQDTGWRIGRAR